MPNIFENLYNRVITDISARITTVMGQSIVTARNYRTGNQPKQLKVAPLQYDDNLNVNFTGLIADRLVSQLIGKGVGFKFEDDNADTEIPQKTYIDAVWDANKQEILLHRAALAACESGTGYIQIGIPALGMGGMVGKDGVTYPRLRMLDPAFMEIKTLPEDFEQIISYTQEYKYTGDDNKEHSRRQVTERSQMADASGHALDTWVIIDSENDQATGGKWVEVRRTEWPYPFAPIVHWQNLPTIDSPYGAPDISPDVLSIQNKQNGNFSFLNKALRLGIDPFKWGKGTKPQAEKDENGKPIAQTGPDRIVWVGQDGEIHFEQPGVDWQGGLALIKIIRAALFDISRTVDIDSLEDKLGALTNFALKVLYQDNASKIDTKRELFGDALEEINRRLMLINGMDELDTEVIWPDFMPKNMTEEAAYHQQLIDMGVESQQTAAEKMGIDWTQEQERIQNEKQATDNLGSFLLRNFNKGNPNGIPSLGPPAQTPLNAMGTAV